MKVNIRAATISDLNLLVSLARTTFEHSFAADNTPENMAAYLDDAFSSEKIRLELNEEGSQYLVAEVDQTLVGYARVRQSDEVKDKIADSSLELQRIYVDKNYHGLKVGATLIQACIDYCGSRGVHWLWLGVWENNHKALTFYEKWGFIKFGHHVFQMGDDPQTDWLLKKKIG